MADLDRALALLFGAEGGYVVDAGGPTKYGITEKVARANGYSGPMVAFPIEAAAPLYRTEYWEEAHCDSLPWPLSAYVFDASVNQGPETAVRLLEKSLGLAQDGILGRNDMAALAKADLPELGALYLTDRALRYTGTRGFDLDGRGWLKRLFRLAKDA